MDGVTHIERPGHPEPPSDGLDQNEADLDTLMVLAKVRGYAVRRDDPHRWLEWSDRVTTPPSAPDIGEALDSFGPFKPFAFPALPASGEDSAPPYVERPTFLWTGPLADALRLRRGEGRAGAQVRDLASRLDLSEDRRVAPESLGWLIAYRDALALDLRRCAARLEASPDGYGKSPVTGARATLKAWLAEAASHGDLGPSGVQFLTSIAMTAWGAFTAGEPWSDEGQLVAPLLVPRDIIPGLHRAVTVATIIGLRYHVRVRDRIVAPGHELWARLLAAETVLHAALTGAPLDEAWIEEAVRRQQEDEQRLAREEAGARAREEAVAQLRRTLLDSRSRMRYILEVLHLAATEERKTQSVWRDTHELFKEKWREAGLPEDRRPYPTPDALKDAASESNRRKQKK